VRESTGGALAKGPFRSATERTLESSLGEYYERYIPGELLRTWFWNGKAICAEIETPPWVEGDGITTLQDLILRRAGYLRPPSDGERTTLLSACEEALRFFGCSLMTVIPKGVAQLIGTEPHPALAHPSDRRIFDLLSAPDQPWLTILREAGRLLFGAIPESIRENTLFTVDATLDRQQRIWFLQVDDRPLVQPAVYPAIVESLLDSRAASDLASCEIVERAAAEPPQDKEE